MTTCTTLTCWEANGKPFEDCQPVIDLRLLLHGSYGFTVYSYPDDRHLGADPPEDHTPFSHTPWPGSQPYPHGMACDIMPNDSVLDWHRLGAQIVADKLAGVPGTEWIKYVNWTDGSGNCWHDKWEPTHVRSPSSDTGHIHISCRTDYVTSGIVKTSGYDPVARALGGAMSDLYDQYHANATLYTDNRLAALIQGKDTVQGTTSAPEARGEVVWPVAQLKAILAQAQANGGGLTDIKTMLAAMTPQEVSLDPASKASMDAFVQAVNDFKALFKVGQ